MKPSVQINDVCQKDLLRAEYYALSPAKNDREVLRERALEKMQQLKDQMIQALRDTDTEQSPALIREDFFSVYRGCTENRI
ncbi:hypothetical protein [Acinetobacter sp. TSRC1-2]|uniref:hypothetical protein n=1 Tax=unclassified Acinetobacter TaxID=196816 RepID=UPI003CF3DF78